MRFIVFTLCLLAGLSAALHAQEGSAEPPFDMSELEAYYVFYENYMAEDYETALQFGEWMLEAAPREIEGHDGFSLSNQFRRFIIIFSEMAESANDPAEIRENYSRALGIFELFRETFDEDEIDLYEWTMREGRFYHENHEYLEAGADKAFELYEQAYELDTQAFVEDSDGFYAGILLEYYISVGNRDLAMSMIDEIEPLASPELSDVIDDVRDRLYDDPEERVVYLEDRLEGADDRETILAELASLYEDLGDYEKARETAERLYESNPNFDNTRTLADLALSNAEYETAVEYLSEALELSPGIAESRVIARELSDAYQNLNDLQSAREFALKAIELDSDYGEAYLRMASVYAAVISECVANRDIERDDRVVYWLVLDYLERAKEVDPSVQSLAEQRIASYEPVTPTVEDIFFRDWEEGDVIPIDGSRGECYSWIDETTTVR